MRILRVHYSNKAIPDEIPSTPRSSQLLLNTFLRHLEGLFVEGPKIVIDGESEKWSVDLNDVLAMEEGERPEGATFHVQSGERALSFGMSQDAAESGQVPVYFEEWKSGKRPKLMVYQSPDYNFIVNTQTVTGAALTVDR